ncbi:MAG: ATP-binding cassette domain-containing protein [Tenericutes bacterium]|nr:ATP-binding cassette domain-containing protein [Mycoplasmatota bacterium]
MIELKWITKLYPASKKERVIALHNVSISFPEKGIVFLVGPEKSGKTTLLRILSGLDKPSFGDVLYDGNIVGFERKGEKSKFLVSTVSTIFKNHNVKKFESVRQSIKCITQKDETIEKSLYQADIIFKSKTIGLFLTRLEGQKAALARAIAKESNVILVDDPDLMLMKHLDELAKDKLIIVATENKELAQIYADRIVELEFGKVISDKVSQKKKVEVTPTDDHQTALNALNIPRISLLQMSKKLIAFVLLTMSLTLVLSFFASFFALRDFELNQTMSYAMEQNESYIVPLQKYQERAYTFGWPFIVRAGTHAVDDVSLDYILGIKGKTGNLMHVYPAYYFNKSIRDFFEYEISISTFDFYRNYDSLHFTEIIVVDDYALFHEPLLYGTHPTEDHQVLIYDYMADQLLQTGFLSVDSKEDMIGYVLVDRDTNLTMEISGILKSIYTQFDYVKQSAESNYPIEKTYLAELQSIYGSSSLLSAVIAEEKSYSVMETIMYTSITYGYAVNTEVRKLNVVKSVDDLTFIGDISPDFRNPQGMLISNHQLANLLDVDVSEITEAFVNDLDLYESFSFSAATFYYNYLQSKSQFRNFNIPIYGIYESTELDENQMKVYFPETTVFKTNGELRRLYLSLSDDWELNEEVLSLFVWPEDKAVTFFYENVGFLNEDIGIYSADRLIASQTQSYINGFALDYALISVGLLLATLLVSFGYARVSIRWDYHQVLLNRSYAHSDRKLSAFYSLKNSIWIILSILLSVSFVNYLLDRLNQKGFNIYEYMYFNLSLHAKYLIYATMIIIPIQLLTLYLLRYIHLKKLSKLNIIH